MKVNEISTNNSAPIRVYGSFTVHLRLAIWVLNSTQITKLVIKVFLSRDHLNIPSVALAYKYTLERLLSTTVITSDLLAVL